MSSTSFKVGDKVKMIGHGTTIYTVVAVTHYCPGVPSTVEVVDGANNRVYNYLDQLKPLGPVDINSEYEYGALWGQGGKAPLLTPRKGASLPTSSKHEHDWRLYDSGFPGSKPVRYCYSCNEEAK